MKGKTKMQMMMEVMEKRQRLGGLDLAAITAMLDGRVGELDSEELEHTIKLLDRILFTDKEKGK